MPNVPTFLFCSKHLALNILTRTKGNFLTKETFQLLGQKFVKLLTVAISSYLAMLTAVIRLLWGFYEASIRFLQSSELLDSKVQWLEKEKAQQFMVNKSAKMFMESSLWRVLQRTGPNDTRCGVIIALWGSIEVADDDLPADLSLNSSGWNLKEWRLRSLWEILKTSSDGNLFLSFWTVKISLKEAPQEDQRAPFVSSTLHLRDTFEHVEVSSWIGNSHTPTTTSIGRSIHCIGFQRIPVNWPEIEYERGLPFVSLCSSIHH